MSLPGLTMLVEGWEWGAWKMTSSSLDLLFLGKSDSWLPQFRRSSQKSKKSLLCPRLSSDHCPHPVCAIGIPRATVLLCFISGWCLKFKTPNLKGPENAQICSPSPEERLKVCPAPFCPRKAITEKHLFAGVYCDA